MMQRLIPVALVALLGMVLSGCELDLTSPEALEDSLREAESALEGGGAGGSGPGSGGSDPTGRAGSAASSDGGGSGPPPDGWPPNAPRSPGETPSDSWSDPDGRTYAEYDFLNRDEGIDWATDVDHGLKSAGFERGQTTGSFEDSWETSYTNGETGETVVVWDDGNTNGGTTYIP